MADKILDSTGLAHLVTKIKEGISEKSKVSVSNTGTSTTAVNYITVDDTEYKLPTGGGGSSHTLMGIVVATQPTKTEYTAGEKVDVTGIVVKAMYTDEDNVDITSECIYSPSVDTVIYEDTTEIIVSWVNNGITYTTEMPITVTRVLSEITVARVPNKTDYFVGDKLDLTGMIITAIYNSGKTEVVTNYTTDPVEGTIITKTGNVTLTITYTENEITKTVTTILNVPLVTWATGTDEEIVAMVEAADNGAIDLSDYWSVGDERVITLPAMPATNVGETHAEQQVTLVLLNAGGKILVDATAGGRTECSFVVGLLNCLNETGYIMGVSSSSSLTPSMAYWNSSKRRAWCNNEFKTAMLSTGIGSIFKQHYNITAKTYNSTTNVNATDWFSLAAAKEVFGGDTATSSSASTTYYSNYTEFNALAQFEYYKTSTNRKKTVYNSAGYWWLRSPKYDYHYDSSGRLYWYYFCGVSSDGTARSYIADDTYGLAPFGCI